MNAATQGDKAIANSDWPAAIKHFTDALIELPRAPSYYIKRSTAYLRRKPADGGPDYNAALRDAEIGLVLARERAKRELILDAQMRRAIALFQLERYGDAGYIFDIVKEKLDAGRSSKDKAAQMQAAATGQRSMEKHEQELSIWTVKVKGKLSKLGPDSEKAAVTIKEYPENVGIPGEEEMRKILKAQLAGEKADSDAGSDKAETATNEPSADKTKEATLDAAGPGSSAPMSAGPGAVPENIRHEWYQSNDSVVVTLYAKGVPKDKLDVDLQNTSISIQFPLPSGAVFAFTLDPLYAPIDTAQSKVAVLSTKVEIVLRKQTSGQKWSALEASSTTANLTDRSTVVNDEAASTSSSRPSGPAYPTSSRHGVKDWDKLASDLTKKKKNKDKDKAKSATTKDKGEAGDKDAAEDAGAESDGAESIDSDYSTGDPVDAFFKKLYANADPDTRRAMVKSYYESEGTALSTNWEEVSKGKVPVRPPSSD